MHVSRRAVLVVVGVALLAGCSGLPTVQTQSPAPEPTPVTPTQTPTQTPAGEGAYIVTIIDVVDGDTMDIKYRNGTTDTIRLLGVDTPEVGDGSNLSEFEGIPDTDGGKAWLEQWGQRASDFASSEIEDEKVRIVVDEQADRRGSYGRLLVHVYHDGKLLNLQLLAQGYARMFDSEFSKRQQFRNIEQGAQANGIGLWELATPTSSPPANSSED